MNADKYLGAYPESILCCIYQDELSEKWISWSSVVLFSNAGGYPWAENILSPPAWPHCRRLPMHEMCNFTMLMQERGVTLLCILQVSDKWEAFQEPKWSWSGKLNLHIQYIYDKFQLLDVCYFTMKHRLPFDIGPWNHDCFFFSIFHQRLQRWGCYSILVTNNKLITLSDQLLA